MHKVASYKAGGTHITCVAIHPTQPYVLSSSNDHLVKLWDWEQGWRCTRTFEGHTDIVWQVAFNPKDSNSFASVSDDRHVKVISFMFHISFLATRFSKEPLIVTLYAS
jgi:coatomer subunit beta'